MVFAMMKKLFAVLCILSLAILPAHAEKPPKIILLTVYQQMGWGDRIDVGLVDDKGGLWTMTGSASALGWPGGLEAQLEYLMTAAPLEQIGALSADDLFALNSLIVSAEPGEGKPYPAANDAGTEISYALRYDAEGTVDAVRLGMSGDDVYENFDPNAQALYLVLRLLFPNVACYGGTMGPAGFQPVPVAQFLGLDPEAIRTATIKESYIDCETGPKEAPNADESVRDLVLNGTVVGKANAMSLTGGTTVFGFYDADGAYLGSVELYRGLLVTNDGMYRIERNQ